MNDSDEIPIEEEDRLFEHLDEFRKISEKFDRELAAMDVETQRTNKNLVAQHAKQPRAPRKAR